MPKTEVAGFRLTPAADTDLADIWFYSAQTWGVEQADKYTDTLAGVFDMLVAMPEMARERLEFDPPVRVHPSAEHLIVYVIEGDQLAILRVLAARQNWQILLGE